MSKEIESSGRYEGWANQETWSMALWINNDRGLYERARGLAQASIRNAPHHEMVGENIWTIEQAERFALSDQIQTMMRRDEPDLDGIWGDLLSTATSRIEWNEIAANILADVRESV